MVSGHPADPQGEEARRLDATGHRCPAPTLRLRRELERMEPGQELVLLADDPLARIDVPHFLAAAGHLLVELAQEGRLLRFRVRKGGAAGGAGHGSSPG